MAQTKCTRNVKLYVFMSLGIGLSVSGALCYVFVPMIIEHIIKRMFILSEDSYAFNMWKDVPIPIYNEFYLFNVTNPEGIRLKHEKPILEELGPYTFRERRHKNIGSWNDNGTVTYNQTRMWSFVNEKSNGSLNDTIVHLNIPMVAAASFAHTIDDFYGRQYFYDTVHHIMEDSDSDGQIFHTHTVGELLFEGYDEQLMELSILLMQNNMTRFGWFYPRNNSVTDGVYSIFTGTNGNIEKLGLLDTWNHSHSLIHWHGEECNRLDNSFTGEFQEPYKKPALDKFNLFIGDMCRSFPLNFLEAVEIDGIKCNRYWVDPSAFDYSRKENHCYCSKNECPPNGVADISPCFYGIPAIVSFPHLLYADSYYSNQIEGLNPNPKNHVFYIDMISNLGVPLKLNARFQINIMVQRDENLNYTNISNDKIYFPQLWMSINAEADDDLKSKVKLLQNTVPSVITITAFVFLAIGGSILIYATIYAFQIRKNTKKRKHQHKYREVKVMSTNFS